MIFENKGEVVGVSNPHPHCQIYATNFVFKTIETEARASQRYLGGNGRMLFQDIIAAEQRDAGTGSSPRMKQRLPSCHILRVMLTRFLWRLNRRTRASRRLVIPRRAILLRC